VDTVLHSVACVRSWKAPTINEYYCTYKNDARRLCSCHSFGITYLKCDIKYFAEDIQISKVISNVFFRFDNSDDEPYNK